jgi:hypothetical protein
MPVSDGVQGVRNVAVVVPTPCSHIWRLSFFMGSDSGTMIASPLNDGLPGPDKFPDFVRGFFSWMQRDFT